MTLASLHGIPKRHLRMILGLALVYAMMSSPVTSLAEDWLSVGFAHADITPNLVEGPVWLAGYAPGREALSVHDPIFARGLVVSDGQKKIAIVSLDLIGFPLPNVEEIRSELADFAHVVVASTHNHEGPDVIGIWGKTPFHGGVDPAYLETISQQIVETIRLAEKNARRAVARLGVAKSVALVQDSRQPFVHDDKLRLIQFIDQAQKNVGVLVQWNCHPEAMGSRNQAITADFPATTVSQLQTQLACPVVYISGAVGGLMAPPKDGVNDADGVPLREGEWAYAQRYGQLVAELALKAVAASEPITMTPLAVSTKQVLIPVANPWYRAARLTGVVKRPGYRWENDPYKVGANVRMGDFFRRNAIATEVGYLRCGEMHFVSIPGEIYPELVYGGVPDPAAQDVDYPDAPIEPIVMDLIPDGRSMLIGLANDEIGYIVPKRQWDQRAPYAYGRRSSQYGELNSCGPDTAPLIMNCLKDAINAMPKLPEPASIERNLAE
jgi:hypothetical protein